MWALRLASRALPDILLLIKRLWMLLCCKISNFQVPQLCCGVWWGKMASPLPDFSQRCWPVNVPKFRFKCLRPIDNYKPQPHDLTLGQRSHFKTRAAAADSHPSSVHRVSESGESCNRQWPHLQTDNLYTDGKTWQGNHRSQGQTDQGRKQPLPFLVK